MELERRYRHTVTAYTVTDGPVLRTGSGWARVTEAKITEYHNDTDQPDHVILTGPRCREDGRPYARAASYSIRNRELELKMLAEHRRQMATGR